MNNYSFVIPGLLAGCAAPSTDEEAEWIATHHQTVVDLREGAHAQYPENFTAKLRSAGVCLVNIPVEDFAAPSADQMLHFCSLVEQAALSSSSVLVHCRAGIGRTGTMLGAALAFVVLRLGNTEIAANLRSDIIATSSNSADIDPQVLVDYLRSKRGPDALNVNKQREAFDSFVASLKS